MKLRLKRLAAGYYRTDDGRFEFLLIPDAPLHRRWLITERRGNKPDLRVGSCPTLSEGNEFVASTYYFARPRLNAANARSWEERVIAAGELANAQLPEIRRAIEILMRHAWRTAIQDFREREADAGYDEASAFDAWFKD